MEMLGLGRCDKFTKSLLFTTCDVGVVVNFSFIFESTILTAYTTGYKLIQWEHVFNLMQTGTIAENNWHYGIYFHIVEDHSVLHECLLLMWKKVQGKPLYEITLETDFFDINRLITIANDFYLVIFSSFGPLKCDHITWLITITFITLNGFHSRKKLNSKYYISNLDEDPGGGEEIEKPRSRQRRRKLCNPALR